MGASRYHTGINSGDTFFTDANGREMLSRRLNHRDSWPLNVTQPIAGNYYPVTSAAYIEVGALSAFLCQELPAWEALCSVSACALVHAVESCLQLPRLADAETA